MIPLLSWDWPRTPVVAGATVVLALVAHLFVIFIINRTVAQLERSIKKRAASAPLPGRAGRILALARGGTAPTTGSNRAIRRVEVIASLARSVWVVVLAGLVALGLFFALGISLTPVLTSMGLGAMIVGFAAQPMLKDLIAGVFLIAEDQYGIGDQVTIEGITGRVVKVSLRVTQIRDGDGMMWHVRNGDIEKTANASQGHSTVLVDIPFAYGDDLAKARSVLEGVVNDIESEPSVAVHLLEPPSLLGMSAVTSTAVTFTIYAKVAANKQFGATRAIRGMAVDALVDAGFTMPPSAVD
ncbi:MAG: mechanosensitive ion channel family protein [Propionibacteriaceae bacterium]|jgi:small conductance mechanosensitive channel|nr:mechanosensitive ion channel family protein [Propionibacteriaceae bacterium]